MPEAHNEIYKGHHISIEYDGDPQNPRTENDNAATMVCFHGRYILGDEHSYSTPEDAVQSVTDADDDDMAKLSIVEVLNAAPIIWLPLYLYDHSGITISTTPFSCSWDSGQVGFIYVDKDDVKKEWPLHELESEETRKERVLKYLRAETQEYDNYLTGNIYGYVVSGIDADEEPETELESCWGFSGNYEENALKEARSVIDALTNTETESSMPSDLSDDGNSVAAKGNGQASGL